MVGVNHIYEHKDSRCCVLFLCLKEKEIKTQFLIIKLQIIVFFVVCSVCV